MTFGIIGFGRFGQLWAQTLKQFGEVRVYDPNPQRFDAQGSFKPSSLEQVASADMIFLAVPISAIEDTCNMLKPYLKPKSIVMDCCSVKVFPSEVMQRIFDPKQPLIATHPLFGPDSVRRTGSVEGHRVVLCPLRCTEVQKHQVTALFAKMGLSVLESTPEAHDRDMARSQGLVHFIGRGLESLQLQPQTISTPDFQALLNINTMVVNDAWQLFLDMHRYNPFTKPIRQKLIQQLQALDRSIGGADDDKNA